MDSINANRPANHIRRKRARQKAYAIVDGLLRKNIDEIFPSLIVVPLDKLNYIQLTKR